MNGNGGIVKRLLDLVLASALLAFLIPLLLTCAILVKLTSKGPVLFKQERVGRHGRQFMIYKLRTMLVGAEKSGAGLYTVRDDPRFTRIGLILRRWSLDEIPQLLNVIRGEMSLVGPRPLPTKIVERYPREFARILEVRPGLTGLSQVSGRTGLTRRQRMVLDIEYVDKRTLRGDIWILLRTLPVVLAGVGQVNYAEEHEVER